MRDKGSGYSSVEMICLRDIFPNRYRDAKNYKLSEDKIDALVHSYGNSGFWDGSIQARPHPTNPGKYEIAFGHHRVEAARRFGLNEIGLVIAKRSDSDMLRMMADENREEFKHDPGVAINTIAAVIKAYGRGEIELDKPDPKTNAHALYHAAPSSAAYTCSTVARFLGWTKRHGNRDPEPTNTCRVAFEAYHGGQKIQRGVESVKPEYRTHLAVEAITDAARAARIEAKKMGFSPAKSVEAEKRAIKAVVESINESETSRATQKRAGTIGRAAAQEVAPTKERRVERAELYSAKLIDLSKRIEPYSVILDKARELLPVLQYLSPRLRGELADALLAMAERSTKSVEHLANALRRNKPERITALLEDKNEAKSSSAV